MKLFSLILLCFGSSIHMEGQNLLPNHSFEDYTSCPSTLNQVDSVVSWYSLTQSPDYYNACSTIPQALVPNNLFGYQPAVSGTAYCGFWCYNPALNYREYIGSQLNTPLTIGTKYFVSFNINLAGALLDCVLGINKMGCKLSTVGFGYNNLVPNNNAQFYTDSIITDTLNWILIKGSFIADSSYQFIAFGNFFDDNHTDTAGLGLNTQNSYYFIDDVCLSSDSLSCIRTVSLEEISSSPLLNIFPNPFTAFFTISSKLKVREIKIFNDTGIEVYNSSSELLYQNNLMIKTQDWSNGIYLLQININGKIQTIKIIKEN